MFAPYRMFDESIQGGVAMTLYTIGYSGKSAEEFYETLRKAGIRKVIDIRLHPSGQLAGFAQQRDLPYLLDRLVDGCVYEYRLDFAPTPQMLKAYRDGGTWESYMAAFEGLMDERGIADGLSPDGFDGACLLCSEPSHNHCHRGIIAARMERAWPDCRFTHL